MTGTGEDCSYCNDRDYFNPATESNISLFIFSFLQWEISLHLKSSARAADERTLLQSFSPTAMREKIFCNARIIFSQCELSFPLKPDSSVARFGDLRPKSAKFFFSKIWTWSQEFQTGPKINVIKYYCLFSKACHFQGFSRIWPHLASGFLRNLAP